MKSAPRCSHGHSGDSVDFNDCLGSWGWCFWQVWHASFYPLFNVFIDARPVYALSHPVLALQCTLVSLMDLFQNLPLSWGNNDCFSMQDSPSSTVSELHCPWYGHNAFGTSLLSSGYPAIIMSVRVLSNGSSWIAIFFLFFFKIFGGHESFLWGHWYPYFGLLVMSPLGFKARVGSLIRAVWRHVLHVAWDSPLVWYLPTSWWPAWQPSCLFHIPARHWWDSKLGVIMPLLTVWNPADALLTELSQLSYILDCKLIVQFLRSIDIYVIDRDVQENLWCILRWVSE